MRRARQPRLVPVRKQRRSGRSRERRTRWTYGCSAYVAPIAAATLTTNGSAPLLLRRRKRHGVRAAVDQRLDEQRRAHKRCEQLAPNGVRIRPIRLDAEFELLRLGGRHIERSEHPIPEREAAPQILVE